MREQLQTEINSSTGRLYTFSYVLKHYGILGKREDKKDVM